MARVLKRYMRGEDVKAVKDRLAVLGYLAKSTHDMYGNDTYAAVKRFQEDHFLEVDGVVGGETCAALFKDCPTPKYTIPEHISDYVSSLIAIDLDYTSQKRADIVCEALKWAVEPNGLIDPKGFYIRGANAFDTDLSAHIMTKNRLDAYFRKSAYEPYYDGGRKEWMLETAARNEYSIMGADCSGFVVGVWRKHGVVKPTFDANANWLYQSGCTPVNVPSPGDLAWKSGHIGIYVGGGYIAEAAGGAYGIQLTKVSKRSLWDYVKRRNVTQKGWASYGDPKYY